MASIPKSNPKQMSSSSGPSKSGDPNAQQRRQLDSFNLRTNVAKPPPPKTPTRTQKSSSQTPKMNPITSSRPDTPTNNSKTPQIPQNKAISKPNNTAALEKPKPAVSKQNLAPQAKPATSANQNKQINSTSQSNTPKAQLPNTKPKPTSQTQLPVAKPKPTATNSNALSSLPSLKQETPSIKKESQPNTPKKGTPPPNNRPPVKKTPSSATVTPKPPSTNTLPSVKKTPVSKPMSSSAPAKDASQSTTKKTGPAPNQKKAPNSNNNNNTTDPNAQQPAAPKPAPKAKPTPAMVAVARKMAFKPTAGAVMKKNPSASNISALPSMKTAAATAAATTPKPTATAQKSPNTVSQTLKRTLSSTAQNSTRRPASIPKPMGGGAKRQPRRPSHFSEVDEYDLDDDFIDNTGEENTAPLNLTEYLKNLGLFRGATSLQTYKKLDPHYDPAEMEGLEDDGDECVEVNSFSDMIAMESKTVKRAIAEDKREREEEKRLLREEANKKRTASTPASNNTSKKKKTA